MKDFKIETHMHTSEVSRCGKVPARDGIRLYHELGYDGVCITDHFFKGYFDQFDDLTWEQKIDRYLTGYRAAKDEGDKLRVKVILGMEYCFPDTCDDILIYGFDEEFLYEHENMHLLNEDELKKFAKEHNLLLIQAHPFRKMISKTYDNLVEGFEVFNGNPRHDSMNDTAHQHAKGLNSIMISGSDFHQVQDAGIGGIILPRIPRNSLEFAQILREIKEPVLVRDGKRDAVVF
ncbi:MAG: PHP domain-containing protein [Clostridiaceae bacterium]|nr:PHP domain-containing protein [Clostridiaceae bacterium]